MGERGKWVFSPYLNTFLSEVLPAILRGFVLFLWRSWVYNLPETSPFHISFILWGYFSTKRKYSQHSGLLSGGEPPWEPYLPGEKQTVQLWIQQTLPRSIRVFKSNTLSFHVIQSPVILLLCLIWSKPQQPNHLYCKLHNFLFLFPSLLIPFGMFHWIIQLQAILEKLLFNQYEKGQISKEDQRT